MRQIRIIDGAAAGRELPGFGLGESENWELRLNINHSGTTTLLVRENRKEAANHPELARPWSCPGLVDTLEVDF